MFTKAVLAAKAFISFLLFLFFFFDMPTPYYFSIVNFYKNFSSRPNSSIQIHTLKTQAAVTSREICNRLLRLREELDQ